MVKDHAFVEKPRAKAANNRIFIQLSPHRLHFLDQKGDHEGGNEEIMTRDVSIIFI